MDLFRLLEQQLENQNVGTLTLGRSKRFREIFFDREAIYTVGNEFAGKVDFECLLETKSVWKRIDLPSLEAIILSTDLKHNLLPQVLFDQGLVDEKELEPLAEAQLREEIIDLLSQNTGSFHYQEGRVPEYLLQYDAIHTRIPVKLRSIVEELQQRSRRLSASRALIPSEKEIFVLTERGMAYRQTSPDDFMRQRILGMIDGFRDLETVLNDSYFFEHTIIEYLADALENGYIKKTIHPELKGISTRGLSPEEAKTLLPHFKNAVKYGVDELAARERLAVIYEKVGMIDDAVIQYNFIGDTLFQMRKSAKAVKAYQRALTLKPGEILLTDKITRIYLKTADQELATKNTTMAIQLLEGAVTLRPDDSATAAKLVNLLTHEGKIKEMIELGENLMLTARKTRAPDAAICVLRGCLALQKNNASIRRRLINLYLDFEMRQEAAEEMEVLARSYLERSQHQKAEEVLEKIRLLPGLRYDTRSLQRAIKQRLPSEEGRLNKGAALRVAFLGVIILMSVHQAWAFIAWSSIQRGYNLAYGLAPEKLDVEELIDSLDEEERESLVILPGSNEARLRALVSRYDRYLQEFPISIFAPVAVSFREWAQKSVDALANVRTEKKKALLARAQQILAREGNVDEVETILAPLLELKEGDPFISLAESLQKRAKGQSADRPSASELYAIARRLEERKEYRKAARKYSALLKYYPRSSWARKVRIPILVDSVPRGAQVFEAETLLGTTPFPVHLNPGEATLLEARLPGFHSAKGEWISADEFAKNDWGTLVFLLAREPSPEDRVFTLEKGRVASQPEFAGDYIFWGDNVGRINWGSLTTGEQSHLAVARQGVTLIGRPTVTKTAVYSRWSDGTVVRYLSLESPPDQWSLKEFDSGRIITTDLMAVNDLALFGSGGRLKVVDSSGITVVYKPTYDLRPRVLAPHSKAGQILVGGDDGLVRAIEVEKKVRVWGGHERVCDNQVKQLAASGDVVVVSDGTKIVFLDGRDGSPLGRPLSTGRRYCIHADAGRIFRTSPSRGFEVFDIATQEALPVPPLLREIVAQNEVIRLSALSDALVLVIDGGPLTAGKGERRVLICDARTLKPLLIARSATPVGDVALTETHVAIVEAERITVFKR